MRIVWDEAKRLANREKHGMDFADLDLAFFEAAVVEPGRSGRFRAIATLDGRTVSVIVAPLGSEAISVVSMRPASVSERRLFRG